MTAGTTARERDKELSLVQHLGELRSRLVVSAIALVITTTLAFVFGTLLIRILLIPWVCTFFIPGMGLVFEVPVAIFALVKIHVITRAWLAKQRRYAILAAFVIGAVITPTPDPFNQTLVAVPMYLLFELGLFVARFA